MKKFAINEATIDYIPADQSVEEALAEYEETTSKVSVIGLYDSLEEARANLPERDRPRGWADGKHATATVWWIDEGEYDKTDEGELECVEHVCRWDYSMPDEKGYMTIGSNDFRLIMSALKSVSFSRHLDDGFIVEYGGDLYFICDPDKGYEMTERLEWCDIERHWCYEDLDEGTTYYDEKGNKIDVEGLLYEH